MPTNLIVAFPSLVLLLIYLIIGLAAEEIIGKSVNLTLVEGPYRAR